jgi:hypothetical protein
MTTFDGPQRRALHHLLHTSADVVLAGVPGGGKSHVVAEAMRIRTKTLGRTSWALVLCPTQHACSAYGPEAQTVDAFVAAGGQGIAYGDDPRAQKRADRAFVTALARKRVDRTVDRLILDEFGLMRGSHLTHLLHWRAAHCPWAIVWLIGDFGQLVADPPPWRSTAFTALLRTAGVLCLTTNYRAAEGEDELLALQSALRLGTLCRSSSLYNLWNQVLCTRAYVPDEVTVLTAALSTSRIHIARGAQTRGGEVVFVPNVATVRGSRIVSPGGVTFGGIGSRVRLTRALVDEAGAPRAQGLVGEVTAVDTLRADRALAADNIRVCIAAGETFWVRGSSGVSSGADGSVKSNKLCLADVSVLTVQAAQGITLTGRVVIDGRHGMAKGWLSVALTRATTLANVVVRNCLPERADELAPTQEQITWCNRLEAMALNAPTDP